MDKSEKMEHSMEIIRKRGYSLDFSQWCIEHSLIPCENAAGLFLEFTGIMEEKEREEEGVSLYAEANVDLL